LIPSEVERLLLPSTSSSHALFRGTAKFVVSIPHTKPHRSEVHQPPSTHPSDMPIRISHLDHLVLTVKSIQKTTEFYTRTLGMQKQTFKNNTRHALTFGSQKINLHEQGSEIIPRARHPTSGSADLCFITETPIEEAMEDVIKEGVEIEVGIVEREGAVGKIKSIYFRDPDFNLIEVSNYEKSTE
jgi:catechol 2,3-dioxygenase-like lactoylglutathione lyase family enzyme